MIGCGRDHWDMPGVARYDGLEEWYDDFAAPSAESSCEVIESLLGAGAGACLDLGCGTGLYFDIIRSTGRTPVGVDVSADQLRRATQMGRGGLLVRSDAGTLPIRDGAVDTVTAMWVSTDVDDFATVSSEAARVLMPGGILLVYGVHPCFNGPLVEALDDGSRVIHPGYRNGGWHTTSPWWSSGGVRSRVGMRHVPLAELLNAIAGSGLHIVQALEPRAEDVPYILALVARKP
jgi:SAM-dependent methyltransferase